MRPLHRRHLLAGLTGSALALALPGRVFAQGVNRLIVGYPPGGTLDVTARNVSDALRDQGKAYIVDNRAGAAGRIASGQLKREKADGSALLCTHTSAMTIYPSVYAKLGYDPLTDFKPVSPVVNVTCAFAVSKLVPDSVKTAGDYARWVKANPQFAMYASPAAGSAAHFLGYRFGQVADLKLAHVPYKGSAPAMQDLLGAQIAAYMGFVADFMQYEGSDKLRILGVTGDKRSRFMPGVPTFAEQGFGDVVGSESYGLFLPPGASDAVAAELGEATQRAAANPALVKSFDKLGFEVVTSTPAAYVQRIARERERWTPIVAASGFRIED